MDMHKGTIVGLTGSHRSSLAHLVIEDAVTGARERVLCENGATVRSLEQAFGDVIASGHNVNTDGGHIGQEIYWCLDDTGLLLEGFMPVDEADLDLIEAYNNQEQEGWHAKTNVFTNNN